MSFNPPVIGSTTLDGNEGGINQHSSTSYPIGMGSSPTPTERNERNDFPARTFSERFERGDFPGLDLPDGIAEVIEEKQLRIKALNETLRVEGEGLTALLVMFCGNLRNEDIG